MSSRKLRAIARRLWGPKTPSFVEAPISSTLSAGLPSRYQLAIEDEPADAAVEVLPRALEAFNENRWPGLFGAHSASLSATRELSWPVWLAKHMADGCS